MISICCEHVNHIDLTFIRDQWLIITYLGDLDPVRSINLLSDDLNLLLQAFFKVVEEFKIYRLVTCFLNGVC